MLKLYTELGGHCLPAARPRQRPAPLPRLPGAHPCSAPVRRCACLPASRSVCRFDLPPTERECERRGEDTQQKQKSVKVGCGDLARQARSSSDFRGFLTAPLRTRRRRIRQECSVSDQVVHLLRAKWRVYWIDFDLGFFGLHHHFGRSSVCPSFLVAATLNVAHHSVISMCPATENALAPRKYLIV